jgi:hypothetical protein
MKENIFRIKDEMAQKRFSVERLTFEILIIFDVFSSCVHMGSKQMRQRIETEDSGYQTLVDNPQMNRFDECNQSRI